MSRTIKVMSTDGTGGVTEINDSVGTWGELKAAMGRKGLNNQNIKGMVRGSRITLEDDGAALPDGDITVFITPLKVKSGNKSKNNALKPEYKAKLMSIYRILLEEYHGKAKR